MPKTDREMLEAAINATGLSTRAFADLVRMDERRMRRVLEENEGMSGAARQLCRLLTIAPHLALELGEE